MANDSNMPNGPHARELGEISAHLQSIVHRLDGLHDEHKELKTEIAIIIQDLKERFKDLSNKFDELKDELNDVKRRQFVAGGFLVLLGTMFGGVLQKYGITFLQ